MAAIISNYFLLQGKSYFTEKANKNALKASLKRSGIGSKITQTEKDIAGSYYDSNTDTIEMAEIYNLNYGPNYIKQLGASDEFMARTQTKEFKDALKKATEEKGAPLTIAEASELAGMKTWESMSLNTDANGRRGDLANDRFGGTILRYPINQEKDNNFDYLQISSYKNEPARDLFTKTKGKEGEETYGFNPQASISDVEDRAFKDPLGRVYLPMQPGLADASSVSWNQDTMNAVDVAMAGAAGGTVEGAAQGSLEALAQGGGNLFNSLSGMVKDLDPTSVAAWASGQIIGKNVLGRTTGKAINNNLELLFTGPTLRTFAYSYRFTPREEKESSMIKKIIRFFKKSMSPVRSKNRIFLESPNVFKLKYIYGPTKGQHPYLNKIKMCALQSFDVQYTPDGSYSTYDDGSMTSYQVSLQFGELNPIYADDYDESDNDMGY